MKYHRSKSIINLPILKLFPQWKLRKTGGWSISPRKKPKQNLISYVSYELRNRPRSLWSLCGSVVENRSAEPNIWGSIPNGDSEFFHCPTLVTRRKNIFPYFYTELKTHYLSYSIYKHYAIERIFSSSHARDKTKKHLSLETNLSFWVPGRPFKLVRWHVARLPSTLVDTLLKGFYWSWTKWLIECSDWFIQSQWVNTKTKDGAWPGALWTLRSI